MPRNLTNAPIQGKIALSGKSIINYYRGEDALVIVIFQPTPETVNLLATLKAEVVYLGLNLTEELDSGELLTNETNEAIEFVMTYYNDQKEHTHYLHFRH